MVNLQALLLTFESRLELLNALNSLTFILLLIQLKQKPSQTKKMDMATREALLAMASEEEEVKDGMWKIWTWCC